MHLFRVNILLQFYQKLIYLFWTFYKFLYLKLQSVAYGQNIFQCNFDGSEVIASYLACGPLTITNTSATNVQPSIAGLQLDPLPTNSRIQITDITSLSIVQISKYDYDKSTHLFFIDSVKECRFPFLLNNNNSDFCRLYNSQFVCQIPSNNSYVPCELGNKFYFIFISVISFNNNK